MTHETKAGRTRVDDPADLGTIIRQRRSAAGLTQKDVAGALGVSRRYVYELERGGPDTRLERTLRTMDILGISVRLEVDGQLATLPAKKARSTRPGERATQPSGEDEVASVKEGQKQPRGWRRWARGR